MLTKEKQDHYRKLYAKNKYRPGKHNLREIARLKKIIDNHLNFYSPSPHSKKIKII